MAISFLKWSGSKRLQAKQIVDLFPEDIDTLYEPFLGSGSVMIEYLTRNPEGKVVASDICQPLISLWKKVKETPEALCGVYIELWNDFNYGDSVDHRKKFYTEIRKEFNADQTKSELFLFLLRTCINGLVRFNSKGGFNSPCHFTRTGMKPETLRKTIMENSELVRNVTFETTDYRELKPNNSDLLYLDPPYSMTGNSMYYGGFDVNEFFGWIDSKECKWCLSFDGLLGGETVFELPIGYKQKHLSKGVLSTFRKVKQISETVVNEAIYTNY